MESIYKYELSHVLSQIIKMPSVHQILCVQIQREKPCLWVKVDLDSERQDVQINIYGTGHIHEKIHGQYIGTFQMDEGVCIFHVFES